VGTPTAGDQALELATDSPEPHKYQLTRWYGTQGDPTQPRRRILKPVPGSVLVGIRDATGADNLLQTGFTLNETNGQVLYGSNERTINGITLGTTTLIDVGSSNGFADGESVTFRDIAGTTELNGMRGTILNAGTPNIEVDIDSTGFTAYTGGGTVFQEPQPDETATAGFLFDLPMRFESDLSDINYSNWDIMGTTIGLVEVLSL